MNNYYQKEICLIIGAIIWVIGITEMSLSTSIFMMCSFILFMNANRIQTEQNIIKNKKPYFKGDYMIKIKYLNIFEFTIWSIAGVLVLIDYPTRFTYGVAWGCLLLKIFMQELNHNLRNL